ncbi:uncharacterized protein LOC125947773 [Dermacentor silvarum]|uniref:uncharacterized protein LOC125947773 n=1 Tax=Dermacentor silvarum TaxID=543639 RepID=UPI0021009B62|nr:uncharacterized protein LOC125947773 [Dermacentor silvarum]
MHQLAQSAVLLNFISSSTGPFPAFRSDPYAIVSLIAALVCKARSLGFCVRRKIVPHEIGTLFSGFIPSSGHSARVCKILKSELHRQARLHRQLLMTQLRMETESSSLEWTLRSFSHLIARRTECEWQAQLRLLRSRLPKKGPLHHNPVHTTEQVNLPGNIHDALALGPKFAVETKRRPEELLTLVRQVSKFAPEEAVPRIVSEGVDVVTRSKGVRPKISVKRVAEYLSANSLCVVPADKEGGFCVLSSGAFCAKASEAVASVFKRHDEVSLSKVKTSAIKLCKKFNLDKLRKNIVNGKREHLLVLFSAKTHKINVPLRVIVSETDSWQKPLALFLQAKLTVLAG